MRALSCDWTGKNSRMKEGEKEEAAEAKTDDASVVFIHSEKDYMKLA